jgi:uncharacterized protein
MANLTDRAIPVQAGERIQVVDVLRGFAILGILLMNMRSFSGQPFGADNWTEALDRNVINLIDFFVQAKFYSLFSFLFGWGIAKQMERAQAKNVSFIPLYMRRLAILFIFGGLHAIFLWVGDILSMYALLGMLLLLAFSKRSERTLLIAAFLALILAILLTLPGESMNQVREWCRSTVECLRPDNPLPTSLYATGTYVEVTQLRFQEYLGGFWWVPCYFGNVFAMMLLGLYVGKRKILEHIGSHLGLIQRTLWIGLAIGVPLNYLFVYSTNHPPSTEYASLIRIGARTFGAPALMLFYVSAIILLFRKGFGRQRLAPLAHVGRMALSNYISHSIICPLIFYGYGLGLYGETDPTFGLLLTVAIYLAQIRLSQWWLARYQYGPLEWLWRTLTYAMGHPFAAASSYESLKHLSPKARRQRTLVLGTIVVVFLAGITLFTKNLIGLRTEEAAVETPQSESANRDAASPEDAPEATPTPIPTPYVLPVQVQPGPLAAAGDLGALADTFSGEGAFAHIQVLAGNSYRGRFAGSTTGHAAGDYIAAQYAHFGLRPIGDRGGYFQSFPLESLRLDAMPSLSIMLPNGVTRRNYLARQEFAPVLGAYAGAEIGEGEVIWVVDCAPGNFHDLNAVGKILLCREGEPRSQSRLAVENGAAGLLLLTDPATQPPGYRNVPLPAWIPQPIPVFRVYPDVARDLLSGSGYSVPDLSLLFKPVDLATRVRMEVEASHPCGGSGCSGRNVLGVLPGSDPAYADQVVVLSANYDGPGSDPNGTIWPGANDNASGVAALLEIARAWDEQGYVPSMTVVFAAWDAGEHESLGTRYYLQHPKYPLDKTSAVIQLEKVGAGGEAIQVNGDGLIEQVEAASGGLGIETLLLDEPAGAGPWFIEAGIPALVLGWSGESTFSHLPSDSLDVIQAERLEQAGRLANLVILGLAEGPAKINDLLARRCEAIEYNDLDAFLNTSTLVNRDNDAFWFEDVGSLAPLECEMSARQVRITGDSIRALVDLRLEIPTESDGENQIFTLEMPAMFQHDTDGWAWAGPDLVAAQAVMVGQTRVTIHHPADKTEGMGELGQLAVDEIIQMADLLSLNPDMDAHLYIYPDRMDLRADTDPSQVGYQDDWIGPYTLKFSYDPGEREESFQAALAQLFLANAGIPRQAFPWLWDGLPLVLGGEADQISAQSSLLPTLQSQLAEDEIDLSTATSWAAVEYIRGRSGWAGLGRLITSLRGACKIQDCETEAGADQALSTALRMDQESFNAAWQEHWRALLDRVQARLDVVLAERAKAVLNDDDEGTFLGTVDRHIPNLLIEEKAWFADLAQYRPEKFTLTGKPLALLEDGSLLASVKMGYELENGSSRGRSSLPLEILFTPAGGGYRWAGPMLESIFGNQIRVRYPAGQGEIARALLEDAEGFYARLAEDMNVDAPQRVTINLYEHEYIYRSSIALSYPAPDWDPGWSAPGHSIKLPLSGTNEAEDYHLALITHLSRHLLLQTGVQDEWLLTGASRYLAGNVAGGITSRTVAAGLSGLNRAIRDGGEFDLADYPVLYRLPEDDYKVAVSQAWDSVRYLAETYGRETLFSVLASQRNSPDPDLAIRAATRMTMPDFATAWKESFDRGHLPPGALETALAFEPDRAQENIDFLTRPELAGRQAGSPGDALAANYIAEAFTNAGLLVEQQVFPVNYQTYLEIPKMELTTAGGTEIFTYREDFLVLQNVDTGGELSGELIWVADDDYTDLELDGKIAVRKPARAIREEIANAGEHGASALILVGDKNRDNELLAKYPFSAHIPEDAIPVFELTRAGYSRLQELTGQSQASLFYTLPAIPLETSVTLRIALSDPVLAETSNVIGLLPGTDPNLGDEYILVGAHYDHVGDELGTAYSGANDNAGGVATLLEIARLWKETGYRPDRSVLFIAWGAQEPGELGSAYYLANPLYPLEDTVAFLDLDAIGGGDGYYLEASGEREKDGLLLFSIKKAGELTDARLLTTIPEISSPPDPQGRYSPAALLSGARMAITGDDLPFRQAGIPTLLLRWQKTSEHNLPDSFADEVTPERLFISGKTITATLMMLAR